MTPKEKAAELVNKFVEHTNVYNEVYGFEDYIDSAKKRALIAVDEIIEMYNEINVNGFLKPNSIGFMLDEVKQEIEKL